MKKDIKLSLELFYICKKTMYRLSTRILGGVCSGLAHMIGIDTLLIRLIFLKPLLVIK